jgi:hypothetical protein
MFQSTGLRFAPNGRRHEMEGIVELRLYPPLNVDAGRAVANPLKPLYFMAFVNGCCFLLS